MRRNEDRLFMTYSCRRHFRMTYLRKHLVYAFPLSVLETTQMINNRQIVSLVTIIRAKTLYPLLITGCIGGM